MVDTRGHDEVRVVSVFWSVRLPWSTGDGGWRRVLVGGGW